MTGSAESGGLPASAAKVPLRVKVAFAATALACIVLGGVAIVIGVPAEAAVPPPMRPEWFGGGGFVLVFWIICSVGVWGVAVARARTLVPRGVHPTVVAVRGGLWIWGAVSGPWLYVYAYWSIGFSTLDPPDGYYGPKPWIEVLARVWWIAGFGALLVAILWSGAAAVAGAARGRLEARRRRVPSV